MDFNVKPLHRQTYSTFPSLVSIQSICLQTHDTKYRLRS